MRTEKSRLLVVAALMLVFACLGVLLIGRGSIWFDESFTYMLAEYDLGELLQRAQYDVHPPAYYLLLKAWMSLFGSTIVAMRSLSLVFGILCIPLLYVVVSRLKKPQLALASSLLLAINPFWLRYSVEARMYTLAAFMALAATYTLLRHRQSKKALSLVVYTILGGIGLLIHYYFAFVLAAHALWLLYESYLQNQSVKGLLQSFERRYIAAWVGILGIFAVWLPAAVRQFQEVQGGFWIQPVDHRSLYSTFTKIALYFDEWKLEGWQAVGAMALCVFTVIGFVRYVRTHSLRSIQLPLLIALVPIGCIFVLSLPPLDPVYNNRYFSLTTPFIMVLFAGSLLYWLAQKNHYLKVASLAIPLSFLLGITNTFALRDFNSDNLNYNQFSTVWEQAEPQIRDDDLLLSAEHYAYFDVSYYASTSNLNAKMYTLNKPYQWGGTSLVYDREDLHVDDLSTVTNDRVWTVYFDSNDIPPAELPANWSQQQTITAGNNSMTLYLVK
ncbi:TPA: hypothetical protein EYO12_00740 [Candidatus Saccharibacteria bacterium]|nr:hypothetical protein [Candidatus Saccharibacteria bacterium]HIO87244.1 hypothetical protein [Candidatus Saccharibacteria bacterium]